MQGLTFLRCGQSECVRVTACTDYHRKEDTIVTTVDKSIDVTVPVEVAYNAWTDFESFPTFMHNVTSVRRLTDRHLHWEADIGSAHREWDAEITELVPNELIAWRSTTGTRNDGQVRFEALSDDQCRITVSFDHEPGNWVEGLGDKLGVVSTTIEADLERFRDHIQDAAPADEGADAHQPAADTAGSALADDYGLDVNDPDRPHGSMLGDPSERAPDRAREPAMAGSTWDSTPAPPATVSAASTI